MEQNTEKTAEEKRVIGVPFTKDDPRINREGRPKGTRDFATDFDEVVEEIAAENGITKSQARKHLLKVAYKNAKEGNYSFYKDIHDRVYGQAKNNIEHSGNVTISFDPTFNDSNTSRKTKGDSSQSS